LTTIKWFEILECRSKTPPVIIITIIIEIFGSVVLLKGSNAEKQSRQSRD